MHCPLFSVDAKIEAQLCGRFTVTGGHQLRPVRLAYQPPANSTFLNKPATTNQSAVLFSQNKPAPATSQTNRYYHLTCFKIIYSWIADAKDLCSDTGSQSRSRSPQIIYIAVERFICGFP
jgi:hypothetical protein